MIFQNLRGIKWFVLQIVTSLARKTSASKDEHDQMGDPELNEYSPVPQPKPCPSRTQQIADLLNYDTPPQPRSLWGDRTSTPLCTEPRTASLSSIDLNYANLFHNSSSLSDVAGTDLPKANSLAADTRGEEQEYLDMSGRNLQLEGYFILTFERNCSLCVSSGAPDTTRAFGVVLKNWGKLIMYILFRNTDIYLIISEYQKDVTILVDAWDKRNDAKTFLSKYQHTISKLKENFHFKTQSVGKQICFVYW